MTIKRFHVGPRLSEMAVHGDTIYLAGQVAGDPTQDMAGQTLQVLALIDKLLHEAGSDKSNILSTTIYVANMAEFPAMNTVWDKWVGETINAAEEHPTPSHSTQDNIPHMPLIC